MLGNFIPGRHFPYPKSLYAVEDAIRLAVRDKPNAVVLDFFAGSGTTTHAVMRLNRQDDGRRRSICVTNNEVSDEEAKRFRADGLRPGDREWEAFGIFEFVTKPRITAAMTGKTPDGDSIAGEYTFTDEFPMNEGFEENVEFFNLTYEDPERVRHDLDFAAVAPLLWMKTGPEGSRIDEPTDTFAFGDRYGVLFSVDAAAGFVSEVRERDGLTLVYIVTDDEKQFQIISSRIPPRLETVRLYESYLRTFRINREIG